MTSLNHRTIAAAIAVAAALQLGLMKVVSAQNASGNEDWCPDKRFENMNATASYSVPGFSPPGENDVNGDSTWTFSTGAVAYDGNTTQRVWINTSPAIQVDSDSLPYQGCVLALFSLTKEAPAGKDQDNKDDGDCKSYLGEECVAAILKNSNAVAQNFSTQVDEDSQNFKKGSPSYFSFPFAQCSDFPIRAIPDECGDASQIYSTAGELHSLYTEENPPSPVYQTLEIIFQTPLNSLDLQSLQRTSATTQKSTPMKLSPKKTGLSNPPLVPIWAEGKTARQQPPPSSQSIPPQPQTPRAMMPITALTINGSIAFCPCLSPYGPKIPRKGGVILDLFACGRKLSNKKIQREGARPPLRRNLRRLRTLRPRRNLRLRRPRSPVRASEVLGIVERLHLA